MKRILITLSLILVAGSLSARQKCDCTAELDFVYKQMKTTASFKSQIKGGAVADFEQTYLDIRKELTTEMPLMDCFQKLQQLMDEVRDKHTLLFSTRPDFGLKEVLDSAFAAEYRKSDAFLNHPKVSLDLEALETSLSAKSIDDIEGIYQVGSVMKLGIYKSESAGEYQGVILESKLGTWVPGQVMLHIKETERANEYDIFAYGQVHKNLVFHKAQLFQFGYLFGNVVKEGVSARHSRVDREKTKAYELTRLNADVQYVWLDGFRRYEKEAQRDALVAQINKDLTAPHLIVDLRDNGGGASKISIPILRAIKKKPDTKVYILTNFFTGSNGEQMTVRLTKIKGALHLGQRTNGVIAYGRNYNHHYQSPSGLFSFFPTDMKFNHFLMYEEVGIAPDVVLNNESDWLTQTLNYINAQNL